MPRAKTRTPELRDHLLRVALETLAREGVGGFTTRKVARGAETSAPALYELFGDKAGLLREIFFEGFRMLRRELGELEPSEDPLADLAQLAERLRSFVRRRPVLAELMFSRPFAAFDPRPDEIRAGSEVREFIVGQVERALQAGRLEGDATDIAHALLALSLGLASAEAASRLGRRRASVDRRFSGAVRALLRGYAPGPS